MTHDSFAVSKAVGRRSAKRRALTVKILQAGDAGAALNQAMLTAGDPQGDVDLRRRQHVPLPRARRRRVRAVPLAERSTDVQPDLSLDPTHRVTPVDHGDVCINVDKAWFADARRSRRPRPRRPRRSPRYEGPARRREPGHVVAGARVPARDDRDVRRPAGRTTGAGCAPTACSVVDGWEEAYDGAVLGRGREQGHAPDRRVATRRARPPRCSSAEAAPTTAPTARRRRHVLPPGRVRRRARGARTRERGARKLVDFMLSQRFQADIPLQMFVFPVREAVAAADGVRPVRGRAGAIRSSSRPRRSTQTATAGSTEWTTSCCGEPRATRRGSPLAARARSPSSRCSSSGRSPRSSGGSASWTAGSTPVARARRATRRATSRGSRSGRRRSRPR